jgi:hypothetical protein
MRRMWLLVGYSFLSLCLLRESSFAQDKVRVGVAVLGSASGGLTGAAGRDRLVKSLNKQKKAQVEATALDASGDQISAEARQKNCEFVVVTTQTDMQTGSEVMAGRTMTSNVPKYTFAVGYKLYRVSDATVVASGSAKAEDMASPQDVEGQALDSIAKKVASDIKNAAVAPATK